MKNPIFEANPGLDCYYETIDGSCFFTDSAAKNHAKSLADKTVKTHHKSNSFEAIKDVVEQIEPVLPVEYPNESELAEQIEVTAEIVEPTEPEVEPKEVKPSTKK